MAKFCVVLLLAVILNGIIWVEGFSESRVRRHTVKYESQRWPGGIVPFEMDQGFTTKEKQLLYRAMKYIQALSCIRFKRHRKESGYIDIVRGAGCSSVVGHIGRRQKLTLASGCFTKNILLHELMHALGFHHEHTRHDRDDHIQVLMENVKSDHADQFPKKSASSTDTLGLPYDSRSIMHYDDSVFTVDKKKKTILPRRLGLIIGKANGLSEWDRIKLKKLYSCA